MSVPLWQFSWRQLPVLTLALGAGLLDLIRRTLR